MNPDLTIWQMNGLHQYIKDLTVGRTILWCYLIWYLVMTTFHFETSPGLWVTALSMSVIIGIALVLSVASPADVANMDRWQLTRLFLLPFCVSSFSVLAQDHGFILIFSPVPAETGLALLLCVMFCVVVVVVQRYSKT